MIEEVQDRIDEIKDLVYDNEATKTVIIKKLRNIKKDICNYFANQKFSVKDMRTREQVLELISKLTQTINSVEKEIMQLETFDKKKIIDVIMNLEENLIETLIQIHVIGEARPLILDIKKDISKKLEKETIKIPSDIEKYDEATIKLYKVLKIAPIKEYTISELEEILELDRNSIERAIMNLEREGYIEKLYKGNEIVVKWTQ